MSVGMWHGIGIAMLGMFAFVALGLSALGAIELAFAKASARKANEPPARRMMWGWLALAAGAVAIIGGMVT